MFGFNLRSIKGRISWYSARCSISLSLAVSGSRAYRQGGLIPALGPGSSMFKPNGNCFFISSENLTEEWSVYCGNTLCVRRKVLNYDCGLLSLIRINIVWPEFWWNTPQYKDTWILSTSSVAYDIWSIFCHASQHSEMMKCLKILCAFFGSRPDIFESFVTSQNHRELLCQLVLS